MTVFIRVLDAPVEGKAEALRGAVAGMRDGDATAVFERDTTVFSQVPGSPFAYWVSAPVREAFTRFPRFEAQGRTVKHGAATLGDFRFLGTAWEVSTRTWIPFAKGGSFSPFYADVPARIRWNLDGLELKAHVGAVRERNGWGDQWTAVLNGYAYYLRPGLTWPLRGVRLSAQAVPAGCIFSVAGKMAFAPEGEL